MCMWELSTHKKTSGLFCDEKINLTPFYDTFFADYWFRLGINTV